MNATELRRRKASIRAIVGSRGGLVSKVGGKSEYVLLTAVKLKTAVTQSHGNDIAFST